MWPVNTVGTDRSVKGHLSLDRKLHLSMKFLTEISVLIIIFIYDLRKTEYRQIEKASLHKSKLEKTRRISSRESCRNNVTAGKQTNVREVV